MLTGPLHEGRLSMSEGTSTVQARQDLRKAANDPDVSAILLAIDSPGGTVSPGRWSWPPRCGRPRQEAGVRVRRRPVREAAYWVASQADRVYANNPTALVGSIGTLMVVYDLSQAAEDQGIKALVFGTGPLKGTGAPGAPVTEAQQEYLRGSSRTPRSRSTRPCRRAGA
jgi:ClpP class serine protease